MKKSGIFIQSNDLYLSYKWLRSQGISTKTIESWVTNDSVVRLCQDGEYYILYKSIPHRSKKRLPSDSTIRHIAKYDSKESKIDFAFKTMEFAKFRLFTKYTSLYKENYSTLSDNKVIEIAQRHAVWQCILELEENGFDLQTLHEAWLRNYPGKIKSKVRFCTAKTEARTHGIERIALDKRTLGNNRADNKEDTPLKQYAIALLVSCNGKYSDSVILEKANTYFREKGLKEYKSRTTIGNIRREWLKNIEVYKARHGQIEANKLLPYASLIHGKYSNDSIQMDGVSIGIWGIGFKRLWLVFAIDSCSKKIVGSSIGFSENVVTIMEAIRNTVRNNGIIPFELVTDNHAAHQTREIVNIKETLAKKGSTWRITSNPQDKSIVERRSQHLNARFKKYPGYLGLVKGRRLEDKISDEQKTEYAKNPPSFDEIKALIVLVIEDYNNSIYKDGKTPNQLYQENLNPHPIYANEFDRAELLINKTKGIIRRGQITIKRDQTKYEYQLPADLYDGHNNTTVIIRYDNLRDGIYIFEEASGEAIGFLPPKTNIHAVPVNQTEEDIKALNKHSGRLKGIKSKARKTLEELTENAHQRDPDAFQHLSPLTTEKHVLQEMQENADLRWAVEEAGVNIDNISSENKLKFKIATALQPKQKRDDQPFKVKKNHEINMIDPYKDLDNE